MYRMAAVLLIVVALSALAGACIWAAWLSPPDVRDYVLTIRGVTPGGFVSHNQVVLGIILPAIILGGAGLAGRQLCKR